MKQADVWSSQWLHESIAGLIRDRFLPLGVDIDLLEDLASEALLEAHRRLAQFDPGRGVKPWTYLRPSILGHLRNYVGAHYRTIPMEDLSARRAPRHAVTEVEVAHDLQLFMRQMPPSDAAVLRHLLAQPGMSQRQIGQLTGQSRDQVKRALVRIRKGAARWWETEQRASAGTQR